MVFYPFGGVFFILRRKTVGPQQSEIDIIVAIPPQTF